MRNIIFVQRRYRNSVAQSLTFSNYFCMFVPTFSSLSANTVLPILLTIIEHKTMQDLTYWKRGLIFAIAALLLCIAGFYNGFPLHFHDTYSYIAAGFNTSEMGSRPIGYSFFVRHISLHETLWLVVFMQGVLLAMSIWLGFKYLFRKQLTIGQFLAYITLITTTTAVSIHTSIIMPDIFTPMLLLSFLVLLLGQEMSLKDKIIATILLMISLTMHNVHFWIICLTLLFVGVGFTFAKGRSFYQSINLSIKRVAVVFLIMIGGNLLSSTLNFAVGGNFSGGTGGGIFLFARLTEFGIAQEYLKENCDKQDLAICEHFTENMQVGNSFLWDGNSPLYKTGGWDKDAQALYGKLSKDILTTPKHFKQYLIRCIEESFVCLSRFELNEGTTSGDRDFQFKAIEQWFPLYHTSYWQSRQVHDYYTNDIFQFSNLLQNGILGISLIILLVALFDRKYITQRQVFIIVILFVLFYANSFVSGAVSGPFERYQSRIFWLLTLPAFALVLQYWQKKKEPTPTTTILTTEPK